MAAFEIFNALALRLIKKSSRLVQCFFRPPHLFLLGESSRQQGRASVAQ
jgi:hypothetical protein